MHTQTSAPPAFAWRIPEVSKARPGAPVRLSSEVTRRLSPRLSLGWAHVWATGPPGLGFELLGGEGPTYLKLPNPVHQGCPLHSQTFRCTIPAAHHPVAGFKGTDDMISLDFLQTQMGRFDPL